jgi:hypothetical protein
MLRPVFDQLSDKKFSFEVTKNRLSDRRARVVVPLGQARSENERYA